MARIDSTWGLRKASSATEGQQVGGGHLSDRTNWFGSSYSKKIRLLKMELIGSYKIEHFGFCSILGHNRTRWPLPEIRATLVDRFTHTQNWNTRTKNPTSVTNPKKSHITHLVRDNPHYCVIAEGSSWGARGVASATNCLTPEKCSFRGGWRHHPHLEMARSRCWCHFQGRELLQ